MEFRFCSCFDTELDECISPALNDCPSAAVCSNTNGRYECACKPGYVDSSNNYNLLAGRFCFEVPTSAQTTIKPSQQGREGLAKNKFFLYCQEKTWMSAANILYFCLVHSFVLSVTNAQQNSFQHFSFYRSSFVSNIISSNPKKDFTNIRL